MRQLSLLDDCPPLAGAMPALRASMNRVAGDAEGEGRKALVDTLNRIARAEGVKLTDGSSKALSKDSLDKILNPNELGHAPSIPMLLVFCKATGDVSPLRVLLRALSLDLMTEDDRYYGKIGRAEEELRAARKRVKRLREDRS